MLFCFRIFPILFFADIAYAVDEYAFSNGYTTILCNTNWKVEIEAKHLDQLQNQRVDGIIYKPAGKFPLDLSGMSIPSVLISCIPGENDNYIEVDNYNTSCKEYTENTLYLEISALNKDNKTISYKIPVSLNETCKKD